MKKGIIIFLNGVSSSGKTTLAKALHDLSPEPPYYISNDLFAAMIPGKYFNDTQKINESFSIMYSLIKTFSDKNVNIVVDSLLLSFFRMHQCVETLHNYPVLFVKVTCPSEELRRREEKRGDREIGQGESQLVDLVPIDTYDITVDTYNSSTEDCADMIIKLLNCPENFTAFKDLWEQF
ncbi:MAG: AAA family ATPase [Eubacteriales bacterium]